MDALYTTHDISRMLQVDPSTVSKWIDRGILIAFRTPGGHRRVRSSDLRSFLLTHEMPVPDELGSPRLTRPGNLPCSTNPLWCPFPMNHFTSCS